MIADQLDFHLHEAVSKPLTIPVIHVIDVCVDSALFVRVCMFLVECVSLGIMSFTVWKQCCLPSGLLINLYLIC